jgi:hypothetical protein
LLYERALKQLPGSYKLWFNYLIERKKHVKGQCIASKAYKAVNNAFERALVYMNKVLQPLPPISHSSQFNSSHFTSLFSHASFTRCPAFGSSTAPS